MRGLRATLAGLALSLAVFGLRQPTPAAASAGGAARYAQGEVLVKLYQASDLAAVASSYRLDPAPLGQFGSRPIYRLRLADDGQPQARARALQRDPRVEYAEPNYLNMAPGADGRVGWSTSEGAGSPIGEWVTADMRLAEAHAVSRGGGVTVAVLDTGVDTAHPALAGRLAPGYDFVDNDADPSEEGDPLTSPSYGHGTHVSGLVALAAPEARIMPLRVLDSHAVGNTWVLAEALEYAADPDGNPATDDGADVINLSLSTPTRSNLVADVIAKITCDRARAGACQVNQGRGVVVVAAAGNSGSPQIEYPAGLRVHGLLGVAASTPDDTLASFSNWGGWVDIAAPGENVLSSVPGGYASWSGTSMASPLVAGEAALVWAAGPQLSAQQVADQVQRSAAPMDSRRFGRADALAALRP